LLSTEQKCATHVPPFLDMWTLTETFAILVSSIGLTNSSVSLWPFPGIWDCFFISFKKFLGVNYFVVVLVWIAMVVAFAGAVHFFLAMIYSVSLYVSRFDSEFILLWLRCLHRLTTNY
jgi:hypothetical protein